MFSLLSFCFLILVLNNIFFPIFPIVVLSNIFYIIFAYQSITTRYKFNRKFFDGNINSCGYASSY
jgi:hypothetical protein